MPDFYFFFNSFLLGIGLAMDAFSVSMANAMIEKEMKRMRMCFIAGIYAAFQFLMPVIGFVAVKAASEKFSAFQKAVPFIALVLLLYIGGKMLYDGFKNKSPEEEKITKLTFAVLLLQGVATSIDALSVGFTIVSYTLPLALLAATIIAAVTFCICFLGLAIGKKFGKILKNKAYALGGLILIFIGIEIFLKGVIK